MLQFGIGVSRNLARLPFILFGDGDGEVIDQKRDILAPVAQRRQRDGKDKNAVI